MYFIQGVVFIVTKPYTGEAGGPKIVEMVFCKLGMAPRASAKTGYSCQSYCEQALNLVQCNWSIFAAEGKNICSPAI
jgi:hypothetical protein